MNAHHGTCGTNRLWHEYMPEHALYHRAHVVCRASTFLHPHSGSFSSVMCTRQHCVTTTKQYTHRGCEGHAEEQDARRCEAERELYPEADPAPAPQGARRVVERAPLILRQGVRRHACAPIAPAIRLVGCRRLCLGVRLRTASMDQPLPVWTA